MKSIHSFKFNSIIFLLLLMVSCSPELPKQETNKYLYHPREQEIELMGSVMKVDDGIFVLVQNGPMQQIPTIIIPANDSAGTVMKKAYTSKIENQYQASLKPWVKLTGNFLREDSLSPIFKYNYVLLLDPESEKQQLQEMEE